MNIPKQLQHCGFCRIRKQSKAPYEMDWTNKPYSYKIISKFIGENYGVLCGYNNLAVIDCDKEELSLAVKELLPKTFAVKTGGGGMHYYYFILDLKQKIILHAGKEHIGEVQFKGQQVVGAGSLHPNGREYKVINDVGIKTISLEELKEVVGKFMDGGEEEEEKKIKKIGKLTKEISGIISFEELLLSYGLKKKKGNWNCPFHKSEGGQCLSINEKGIFNCFHCNKKGNILYFLSELEGITIKQAIKKLKSIQGLKELKVQEPKEEELEILKDPNLFNLITEQEFDKQITGEYKSRKAIFLSLCSIWVKNTEIPLNTFVSSESSAGKSYVCGKILDIFPKELYEKRSKITAEAFTYWHTNEDNWTWDGKICYLEDINQAVLDSPTFKIMCSEGSIATIVRNQKAVDLFVSGKPCMLLTTARTNPTMELLNRFSITQLDESSKQTHDITYNQALELKNEKYDGNIVSSLKKLKREDVSVPFGIYMQKFITKNYTWNDVRMRRDFSRLRDLIKCSAVLHQHQRKRKGNKIIASEQDYEIAREVISYIQTTTLKGLTHKLKKIYGFCIKEETFTAKDIHSKHPIVSQKMWYLYLDQLCERGLLTTELKDSITIMSDGSERIGKKVTHFKVPETTSFKLPSYSVLITIDTFNTKDTKDTIVTKDTPSNVTNVTNVMVKPLIKELKD